MIKLLKPLSQYFNSSGWMPDKGAEREAPHSFTPCYVWPGKQIPFRLYLEDVGCRIFIIENLQHNFEWLQEWHFKFRKNDHFLVIVGCFYHDALVEEASRMFDALGLNKANFHILANDQRDIALFAKYGFHAVLVNQNAMLDENHVMRPIPGAKIYDAVYVARLIALKRHYLASAIDNLALVAGPNAGSAPSEYIPVHTYRNEYELDPNEVCKKINQSYCGLILSENEGASFVSSEYLLCGVPVVSTPSEGGRSIWYNAYNSIIAEPNPLSIKEAVNEFISNSRDPERIRNDHIMLANEHRQRFIALLNSILEQSGIQYIDAQKYFVSHFIHKMREGIEPNYEKLFS